MCLALPMKLVEHSGPHGFVEIGGARREIALTLTPEAKVGDYLIVHAGYSLEILDQEEAERTLSLYRQMGESGS